MFGFFEKGCLPINRIEIKKTIDFSRTVKKCLNLAWFKEQQFLPKNRRSLKKGKKTPKKQARIFLLPRPSTVWQSEVSHKKVGREGGGVLDLFFSVGGEKRQSEQKKHSQLAENGGRKLAFLSSPLDLVPAWDRRSVGGRIYSAQKQSTFLTLLPRRPSVRSIPSPFFMSTLS